MIGSDEPLSPTAKTAQSFADYLTRKGVYLFNIQDIRKYAVEFDLEEVISEVD